MVSVRSLTAKMWAENLMPARFITDKHIKEREENSEVRIAMRSPPPPPSCGRK